MTSAGRVLLVTWLLLSPMSVWAQGPSDQKGGGLGGVLDALGGLLGGGARKVQGTVVVSEGTDLVLRTNERRTLRVDTAGLDPAVRRTLGPGQGVTAVLRGGAQADVLTAVEIQPDPQAPPASFQQVPGTVVEASRSRVLFKTRDGLTLPVDVSALHGLPYLAADQPATLYYEQGSQQQIVAVWLAPGTSGAPGPAASPAPSQPAASPAPDTGVRGGQSLQGLVQTIGLSSITLETSDGRSVTVDTAGVNPQVMSTIRPGDVVVVTGVQGRDPGRFTAQSVTSAR